ncbi:EF-hand and coiled-coil domain-containing protein 1-like [Castor canadensis]|uniref:EF-hand and coiled-coil domain-containing protein 1-like n=1 Tax=Castor canadensis TaxID=51338 RepID=A0AC58M8C3_CASCN
MSYPIPRPEPSRSLGASGGPGPVSPVPEARGLGEVTQGGLGDDAPQHNRRLSSGARETMPRTAPAGAWRDPHEDECVRWAQGHSPRFLEAEPALTLRRLLEPREARSQEGTSGWGSPRWGQGRGVPATWQVDLWKSQAGAAEAEAGRGGCKAAAQELQGALEAAEARAGRLQRGQAEVRRRAEEAQEAVLRSLRRVRELEALARRVPGLQRGVRRLEAELSCSATGNSNVLSLEDRLFGPKPQWANLEAHNPKPVMSEGPKLPRSSRASPELENESGEPEDHGTRDPDASPKGTWQSDSSLESRAPEEVDEQLFCSVEGQATSEEEDEEEEEWQEEQRPSGCGSQCHDQMVKTPRTYSSHCGNANHTCTLRELEAHITRLGEQRQAQGCSRKALGTPGEEAELQQKVVESEHLRLELQMVETERVQLSLLEEKVVDVLQLLQRLRDLNISKRALGKILLCTLDTCRDPTQEARSGPLAILDTLYQALASCELLQRQPSAAEGPALTNPLLISC